MQDFSERRRLALAQYKLEYEMQKLKNDDDDVEDQID
jgi:hypothetical protein